MTEQAVALTQRFADGLSQLAAALGDLPDEALRAHPQAGEWSIAAVLAHLADTEILAGERFRRIIADPDAAIHPLDQARWAEHLGYAERDPALAASTFRALRAANVEMLRLLPPGAWSRTGRHLTLGPTTLREQVRTFAEHTEEHVAQIGGLRDLLVGTSPRSAAEHPLLHRLARGSAIVDEALAGLPDAPLAARPPDGGWSIGEVLIHLGDSELMGAERFRRIVADDEAIVGWYDEARWAERLRYRDQDPRDGLLLFRTMRAANLRLLRLLAPDAWSRTGRHSTRGPLTLAEMVETYIDHAEDHAAQISCIRKAISGAD